MSRFRLLAVPLAASPDDFARALSLFLVSLYHFYISAVGLLSCSGATFPAMLLRHRFHLVTISPGTSLLRLVGSKGWLRDDLASFADEHAALALEAFNCERVIVVFRERIKLKGLLERFNRLH